MLGAAGVVGVAATSGYAVSQWTGEPTNQWADVPYPDTSAAESRTDFAWAERAIWQNDRLRRNLYAFARQHDLAVVLADASAHVDDEGRRLAPALEQARDAGVEAWANVGVLRRIDAETFATNGTERERHLDGLRAVAERYRERMPGGKLILWQEAPVAGEWIPGGKWNRESVERMQQYGPDVFTAQRRAVRAVSEDLDVGIFLHFPYIVESRQPEVFAGVMDDLRLRESLPDFVFTDFYRGWYEKDISPEQTNEAVRSLVRNARRYSDDSPVYYLGESHTNNPQYTPSKQAMRMDLRASIGAGADGVGWYARTKYTRTELGFDPFVPNEVDPDSLGDDLPVDTITVARDRYLYAWAATFARNGAYAPDRRFDLWLAGEGFDFLDHAVWADTPDGWEFLGDVGGYHPDAQPHVPESGPLVSAVRALEAERYLADGTLRLRVEPREGADGDARLDRVVAVPFDLGAFCTEREAFRLLQEEDVTPHARIDERVDATLDRTQTVDLSVREGEPRPIDELVTPETAGVRRDLARAEGDPTFAVGSYVDLWLLGEGLADLDPETVGEELTDDVTPLGVVANDDAALLFGLPRPPLFEGGRKEAMRAVRERGDLRAAYAMPYFGSGNLPAPAHAAELMRETHPEVANFSVVWARD